MRLDGKVALITGAGRGIGRGCAEAFVDAGAKVVLNDRPGSPDLAGALEEIKALGGTAWAVEADAFSRAGCEQLVQTALQAAGQIDILVSNVAFSRRADFLDCDPEEFERGVQGTFVSGFHIAQPVARHMVERGEGGKFIFISSVQAELPIARCAAYGASKAALNHMAGTMSVELCQHRINVNVIEPGWIDTPGERATFSEETLQQEAQQLPWGRLGTPLDIGRAALFLASDYSDYITGAILPVDGGFRFKDWRPDRVAPVRNARSGPDGNASTDGSSA
ncbi:MAG: SDR family NAD(P)-dependent oxidoreductase [Maioricimonas sp. JB049]